MSRYFSYRQGLRGCYMPDSSNIVRVDSRRELKHVIQADADALAESGMIGLSKRDVAWAAAHAWRNGAAILPYGSRGQGKPYSIKVSRSTRADYLEQGESF